jgi:hypothetical protein
MVIVGGGLLPAIDALLQVLVAGVSKRKQYHYNAFRKHINTH